MTTFRERCRRFNEERGVLCVGIDPRPGDFPDDYDEPDGVERWCLDLIEATREAAGAYKANLAFFLELGPPGLEALEATLAAATRTSALTILDAKFADIGSTAEAYAAFVQDVVGAQAVTLNPYLGTDVLAPFEKRGIGAFVLARTTNPGAELVQDLAAARVIELFRGRDVGFVAPGTDPRALREVRHAAPGAPLLVPGIGAQGGDAVAAAAAARGGPFFVNVSRSIARAQGTFPESAGAAAHDLARLLRTGP